MKKIVRILGITLSLLVLASCSKDDNNDPDTGITEGNLKGTYNYTSVSVQEAVDLNGDKVVSTWTKRLVMIISCFAIAAGYRAGGYEETVILINSSVLAPVAWSWIFKPILKKIGVDYKKIDKTTKTN